jgi:hypothetical protein
VLTRAVLALLVVTLGAVWYLQRPASPRVFAGPAAREVRGAIHVHSTRSDGGGDAGEIAAAAGRAGLNFVIVTDHGDASRTLDAPRYLSGVLYIDAVEISTDEGHVVVLDLPASPYPLGGEARDVLEDVMRAGGFAIAAHPDSEKVDLRWRDDQTPVDGIEWLNGDSEWRDEALPDLARALVMYPVYGSRALVSLLDRPVSTLARWDALAARRRTVGIAATDAHQRLNLRSPDEPSRTGSALPVPSYEQTFRMYSNVLPSVTLSGDAPTDARLVVDAIRGGAVYSVVDGIATPGRLSVTAVSGATTASMGGGLPAGGLVTFRVALDGPPDAVLRLIRNGEVLVSEPGVTLDHTVTGNGAGAYRVEALLPGAPGVPSVPWIVSNPVYVGDPEPQVRVASAPRATAVSPQYVDGPATTWRVERSASSRAALDEVAAVEGRQLSLRYALGGMATESAFAAFVMPAGTDLPGHDTLVFTARADHPMRLSIQLREAGENGARWHRSVYLDQESRTVRVSFDDMRPRGAAPTARPVLDRVDSVLFVVDTVNTPVGGNGTVWLDEVRYARERTGATSAP